MIIYSTLILMSLYHTIYAYKYKKEKKHYENDLEFQWVYQNFKKYILVYIRLKSTHRFLSGNKCTNNIDSIYTPDV